MDAWDTTIIDAARRLAWKYDNPLEWWAAFLNWSFASPLAIDALRKAPEYVDDIPKLHQRMQSGLGVKRT